MSRILDHHGQAVVDTYAPAAETPPTRPTLLPLDRFVAENAPAGHAVLLPNTTDVLGLPDAVLQAPLLVLDFPGFADGRAYSQARLLSRNPRFRGGLRAQGAAVVLDQLKMLRSCGITEFHLRADQRAEACAELLRGLAPA